MEMYFVLLPPVMYLLPVIPGNHSIFGFCNDPLNSLNSVKFI